MKRDIIRSSLNIGMILFTLFLPAPGKPAVGEDADYYYRKGEIEYRAEMYSFAVENLAKALERDPGYFRAANLIAAIHLRNNKKEEALAFLDMSLRTNSMQPDIHCQAGEINDFFNEWGKAFAHYTRAVEIDPFHLKGHLNLVLYYIKQGDKASADRHFEICAGLGKAEGEKYLNLASDEERKGDDKKAIMLYRTAIEKSPVLLEAYFRVAEIHRRSGNYAGAVLALEKIKEMRPDHEKACIYLGQIYFAHKFMKERKTALLKAVANLEKAIEINSENSETYYYLADVYQYMGQKEKAVKARRLAAYVESTQKK